MLREHETLIRLRGPRDAPLSRVAVQAEHVRDGSTHHELQLQQLAPVDAEGNFEADVDAQGWLAAVSPAGIPLLYSLAPQNWRSDVKKVSLHLPSVRRVHQGVDLRGLASAPGGDRLQPIKLSTNLSTIHDGRPVSGADVMVFTATRYSAMI